MPGRNGRDAALRLGEMLILLSAAPNSWDTRVEARPAMVSGRPWASVRRTGLRLRQGGTLVHKAMEIGVGSGTCASQTLRSCNTWRLTAAKSKQPPATLDSPEISQQPASKICVCRLPHNWVLLHVHGRRIRTSLTSSGLKNCAGSGLALRTPTDADARHGFSLRGYLATYVGWKKAHVQPGSLCRAATAGRIPSTRACLLLQCCHGRPAPYIHNTTASCN